MKWISHVTSPNSCFPNILTSDLRAHRYSSFINPLRCVCFSLCACVCVCVFRVCVHQFCTSVLICSAYRPSPGPSQNVFCRSSQSKLRVPEQFPQRRFWTGRGRRGQRPRPSPAAAPPPRHPPASFSNLQQHKGPQTQVPNQSSFRLPRAAVPFRRVGLSGPGSGTKTKTRTGVWNKSGHSRTSGLQARFG